MRASEIAERFACSWPTTSRHLKVLEEAGLVSAVQEGRERFYELESSFLQDTMGGWLGSFET